MHNVFGTWKRHKCPLGLIKLHVLYESRRECNKFSLCFAHNCPGFIFGSSYSRILSTFFILQLPTYLSQEPILCFSCLWMPIIHAINVHFKFIVSLSLDCLLNSEVQLVRCYQMIKRGLCMINLVKLEWRAVLGDKLVLIRYSIFLFSFQ